MKQLRRFMAIIEREGNGYVALCPEVDIASQGNTVEEARCNLTKALELFFETAEFPKVQRRLRVYYASGGCGWVGYACCLVGKCAAFSQNMASCGFVNAGAILSCRKEAKKTPL